MAGCGGGGAVYQQGKELALQGSQGQGKDFSFDPQPRGAAREQDTDGAAQARVAGLPYLSRPELGPGARGM